MRGQIVMEFFRWMDNWSPRYAGLHSLLIYFFLFGLFFPQRIHAQQARLISACKSNLGRGRCTPSDAACEALGGVMADQDPLPTLPRPTASCERGEACCVLLSLPTDDHCMACGQPGADPLGEVAGAGSTTDDIPRRIMPNFEAVPWGMWRPRHLEADPWRRAGRVEGDAEEGMPVSRMSAINQWCWQVALTDRNGTIFASGALIDGQHVVTLARNVYRRPAEDILIVLGAWDFVRPLDTPNEAVWFASPKRIAIHDEFDPMTLANDLAVLRIPLAPCQQRNICPVCITDLPVEARMGVPFSGQERCVITGWAGPNRAGFTTALRQSSVKLVDRSQCAGALRRMGVVGFDIPDSQFCAAVSQSPTPQKISSQPACESDAGAPLVCQAPGDKKWYLRGLISLSTEPCALEGSLPFLSTDVGMFYPWIRVQTSAQDARFTTFPGIPNRHLIRSQSLDPAPARIAVPRVFGPDPQFLRFL